MNYVFIVHMYIMYIIVIPNAVQKSHVMYNIHVRDRQI